jgi:peroxiredoxin
MNSLVSFAAITILCCAVAINHASGCNSDENKSNPSNVVQPSESPEDMQKLLAETGQNYRDARSLRIERKMIMTTKAELMNMSAQTVQSVLFAPNGRYRTELKDASVWQVNGSDGTTTWSWYPWLKEYVEHPAQPTSVESNPALGGFVEFLRDIDKKLASSRVLPAQMIEVDGQPVNCMVMIGPPSPRNDPSMPQQTTYWIDKNRKVLVKEQYVIRSAIPEHSFYSERTTTYITELNGPVPDSMFHFAPPTDAKRVDEINFGPVELAGKPAPPLKLKTLSGEYFDLASLRGQPVLVEFWATWCMPCRESMAQLAELYGELKGKGLALVGVSKDDDPADAARFVEAHKYSWVQVADPKWESDREWGGPGIPNLVLIGKEGKVLLDAQGFDKDEEFKIRTMLHSMDAAFPAPDRSKQ